jgi:hypothetical protein
VGGGFAFAAFGALVEAATELRDAGTTSYARLSAVGQRAVGRAFGEQASAPSPGEDHPSSG